MQPAKQPGRLVREVERTVERYFEDPEANIKEVGLAGADESDAAMGDADEECGISGEEPPPRRRGPNIGNRRGGR